MLNHYKFFHQSGLVKLTPEEEHPDENSILYTITYYYHYRKHTRGTVMEFIKDGKILGPRSHDNMTAVLTYLYRYGYSYIGGLLKILPDYKHPRDIFYIAYVQRRWWLWAWSLLIILKTLLVSLWISPWGALLIVLEPYTMFFIMLLFMALKKYKARPTIWDWVLQGFPPRYKVKKTDTEILYWIRLQLPKNYRYIHWTSKIIVPLLKRKYGEDWVLGMMQLFYRHPDHPNKHYKSYQQGVSYK